MRGFRTFFAVLITVGALAGALALRRAPDEGAGRLPEVAGGPRWFKGNLHTHSLWSDGDQFPEMIGDWYRQRGYHFLALSEHNVLAEGQRWVPVKGKKLEGALKKYRDRFGTDWAQTRMGKAGEEVRLKPLAEFRSLLEQSGKFLLIPAEEITGSYKRQPIHMNTLNPREVVRPAVAGSVAECIRVNLRATAEQSRKTGRKMLTFLNHPNFGWGVSAGDMAAVDELRFFEVYNGHPGVRNAGDDKHPSCDQIWDTVQVRRLGKLGLPPVYGLATDDAHNYHQMAVGKSNPGRGWVMVRAPHLTAEAILEALEMGHFYATSGALLDDVVADKKGLRLKIKPAPGVKFKTEFIAAPRGDKAARVVATSEELSPSYAFTGKELYVRALVTSSRRHPNPSVKGEYERAWTQPALP